MIWYNKTIKLTLGTNLISGKIGTGKSTIIRAIYFCLYGKKKFQDIANDSHKNERTEVSFHFYSPSKEYIIIRSRPSEKLIVKIKQDNGFYELQSDSAQAYINSIFGLEDNFIASSMIAQKKNHFLIDSSNVEKINLIQQITFGDLSQYNQVEPYLQKIKNYISTLNMTRNQLNINLSVQYGIIDNIVKTNPNVNFNSSITEADKEKLLDEYKLLSIRYNELNNLLPKIKSRRDIENKIKVIGNIEDKSQFTQQIKDLEIALVKEKLKQQLINFDQSVIDIDKVLLNNCNEIYKHFIANGWNSNTQDINEFVSLINQQNDIYDAFLKKKEDIDNYNRINEERKAINKSRIAEYEHQLKIHHDSKKKNEEYHSEVKKYEYQLSIIKPQIFTSLEECITFDEMFRYYVYTISLEYISLCEKIKEVIRLKELLTDFDKDILTIDFELLQREKQIYQNVILSGFNDLDNVEEYINNQKVQKGLYEQYLLDLQRNKDIENENKLRKSKNDLLEIQYSNSSIEYNRVSEAIIMYDKQKQSFERTLEQQLNNLQKFEDEDDLSSHYLSNLIDKYNNLINQHICPNCSFGLIIENGILYKGTINAEQKDKYRQKIELAKEELSKRRERERIVIEYNSFLRNERPKSVPVPSRPILSDYLPLVDIKTVEKNKLDLFELPTMKYSKICKLISSFPNISNYHRLIELGEFDQNIDSGKLEQCRKITSKYYKSTSSLDRFPSIQEDGSLTFVALPLSADYYISHFYDIVELIGSSYSILSEQKLIREKLENLKNKGEPIVYPSVVYPELMEIIEVEKLDNVSKPKISRCKAPELSYKETCNYMKSLLMIDTFNKYNSINTNLQYDQKLHIELCNKVKEIDSKEATKSNLEKILSEYPSDIPDIEIQLQTMYNRSIEISKIISEYDIFRNYMKNVEVYNNIKEEYNKQQLNISSAEKLYNFIEEEGRKMIQKKLEDVNLSLKMILDELFGGDIEIELSSLYDLKDGRKKFQISFDILYKGVNITKIDRLSGGEENIVSIALLLSFSRLNSNPLLMMDEVMASLDGEMRDKCMKVINLWSQDKFVLNICHEISSAYHNNTISI